MKKILVAMTLGLIAVSAYAQGTVNFANSGATLIYLPDGVTGLTVGQYTVELLYSSTAPADIGSMTPVANTGIAPVAGRFLGGTYTTPVSTAPGGVAWFAVQAWQNTFASYAAAVAGGGIAGVSSIFQITTGGAGSPAGPATALTQAGGFTGFTTAVPEPSTIALGVLGAAALLLRRRK
jgi:hypothetical protein